MAAVVFRLPDIGEGLTEAEILDWYVEVGDSVVADEPLVAVETDKTQADLPAPISGTLLHHGAEPGTILEVGAVLAVIGEPGDAWDTNVEPPPTAVPSVEVASVPAIAARAHATPDALPLVRRMARAAGVDLSAVDGTGPAGRITRADLAAHIAAAQGSTRRERPPLVGSLDEAAEDVGARTQEIMGATQRRLSPTRRTIAAHMERSWREIPHVTTFASFDASFLLQARRTLAKRLDVGVPLEALLLKSILPALEEFPEFNASLSGDILTLHDRYDIGVAVDSGDGLLIVVVHAVGGSTSAELASSISQLVAAAKERRLRRDQSTGATFTLSNIGAVGGGFGTPIIPYGTTAILSVGRAQDTAVVRDGSVIVAPMAPLSLSYDHRVVDGALGRAFLGRVTALLENPTGVLD